MSITDSQISNYRNKTIFDWKTFEENNISSFISLMIMKYLKSNFHNLDIHGSTDSYVNNNVMTYKNNLNINNTGFLHQKITINKNNNVIGTLTETYNNSFTKNTHTNNTTNIYKNYAFNINNSY